MVQFEVPAIVPADPDANVADLLVKRVEATPDRALFSVPEGEFAKAMGLFGWPIGARQLRESP